MPTMFVKLGLPLHDLFRPFLFLFMSCACRSWAALEDAGFTYNGFRGANISLDGIAQITPNGLLMLTNQSLRQLGHAFYTYPLHFKNNLSDDGNVFTFSTTFVFGILPKLQNLGGHGIAFVITPSGGLPGAQPSQYLGLTVSNNGNPYNRFIAVELDTILNNEFSDIDSNHVGIDINNLTSLCSVPVSYVTNGGNRKNLSLISGKPTQVWVEYNGLEKRMDITLAPIDVPKPNIPLLSCSLNLSPIMQDPMYVGFSSSTGSFVTNHYVLGWSFKMNGPAKDLTISQLPKLPRLGPREHSKFLTVGLPIIGLILASALISVVLSIVRRKIKFAEVVEDWELEYGPHRFKYRDLYIATKGFKEKELLGIGGFGRVYRGVLPTSKIQVAVKRVSHESRQGLREFIAEIVSMGRLRHRNLVQLLGYCRRQRELLLVYDYMPHGSLDKFLFDQPKVTLNWSQRFGVIKGVASGLLYLHEGWEQVVIHRDVKSSNVLLDSEFNGRLGDFGLARLYDRGADPKTTHVVGTFGYIPPEITRTRKASPSTDVFSFGAFMLEVACGRRPIDPQTSSTDKIILVDWVFSCWSRGKILETVDPNLGSDYVTEEMDLVLKLGLLCSHSIPTARPTMRQVVRLLVGDAPLPESSLRGLGATGQAFAHGKGLNKFATSHPSSSLGKTTTTQLSLVADSLLSTGR
ncbi:PREDICTED: L-type lectin-domain containing receptor kinase IV.1-like [Nelumbo nucifera]|uniref:non-specific serine/threonine protein kinase n=2 Tax=Nelumbo nucifera TaxID=4432 RepID=A0A1U8A5T6_NELNU|nr:PREDICTED: L-type lectin-domain containing receptor kinase IV.1-like [Nelumbo nucifera]DAD28265.1 TPA_asm: hypothetical protein HUJ06_029733 [Nelumbo nucifera]